MPCPLGRDPIRSRCSASTPTVRNSESRFSLLITPSAPYLASTSSTAASTIPRSTWARSSSLPTERTASSRLCRLSRVPRTALIRTSSSRRSSSRGNSARPSAPAACSSLTATPSLRSGWRPPLTIGLRRRSGPRRRGRPQGPQITAAGPGDGLSGAWTGPVGPCGLRRSGTGLMLRPNGANAQTVIAPTTRGMCAACRRMNPGTPRPRNARRRRVTWAGALRPVAKSWDSAGRRWPKGPVRPPPTSSTSRNSRPCPA